MSVKESPLGQQTVYIETYEPKLLFPISRSFARDRTGVSKPLPFHGVDIWTGFEISWLNPKGKPEIAMGEFILPCSSEKIVESKSIKLYLNSLNQSHFESKDHLESIIRKDLSKAAETDVQVTLFFVSDCEGEKLEGFSGVCLDIIDIETDVYEVEKNFLKTTPEYTEETVYSNLLKSNCLATGQPDWGSVLIRYAGPKINLEGLLKYIISFRKHSGFAEHCVEQIYCDILRECKPEKLTVYARYTRRGGLDINPFRSNFENAPINRRQTRQ